MMVLVSYDVKTETRQGCRRLRRVAKLCKSWGQRVQYSVFECIVDPAQWALVKAKLMKEIEPAEDSLRFYFLGDNYKNRVEHEGAKPSFDQEGTLIV